MDPGIAGLAFVENLSYIGVFFSVAFSGYAIPIPEEVILILGGYIAAMGISSLPITIIVSIVGAMFGDTVIYYLSGHGSRFATKYHDRIEKTKLGWYVRSMRNHPWRTIFLSRFIVGMRFFNPLVSGLMKVKWITFITAAGASAAIYTPIIILIGYYFKNQINQVLHIAHSVHHILLIIFYIGTGILTVLFIRNLIQKKR